MITLVLVVDAEHLDQLKLTYPTWIRNRPEIKKLPKIVAYDKDQLTDKDVRQVVKDAECIPWGEHGEWESQKHKMLSAFTFVPAEHCKTEWWLKLDADTVAYPSKLSLCKDEWFEGWYDEDEEWHDVPAIIANPWGYTKPPDQMMVLDEWANRNQLFKGTEPLNIKPKDGWSMVRHKRIISWLSFYRTDFTIKVAASCDYPHNPVASQDGLFFYCATRWGYPVRRVSFKRRNWGHFLNMSSIRRECEEAMR